MGYIRVNYTSADTGLTHSGYIYMYQPDKTKYTEYTLTPAKINEILNQYAPVRTFRITFNIYLHPMFQNSDDVQAQITGQLPAEMSFTKIYKSYTKSQNRTEVSTQTPNIQLSEPTLGTAFGTTNFNVRLPGYSMSNLKIHWQDFEDMHDINL